MIRYTLLPILAATGWIGISEFVRNEFLLKEHWTAHYKGLGLVFPAEGINGAIWGLWSMCFAIAIFAISRKYNLLSTFLLSWFIGFVLMWLVVGNMGVLPYSILPFAIPLSLLEAFLASWIIHTISPVKQ